MFDDFNYSTFYLTTSKAQLKQSLGKKFLRDEIRKDYRLNDEKEFGENGSELSSLSSSQVSNGYDSIFRGTPMRMMADRQIYKDTGEGLPLVFKGDKFKDLVTLKLEAK